MNKTVVVFEAGTIADAMKKAGGVAPSKVGASFDQAAGIIMDITPGADIECVIRATDTDIYFIETLDVNSCEGDAVRWRLPAALLVNVIGSQSSGSGKTITFKQTMAAPNQIQITSGSMRSKINLIGNTSYPEWDPAVGVKFTMAPDFGAAVARVMWAAEKGGLPQLSGFRLTGDHIIATDRYRVARFPLKIELEEPITVPALKIGQLLRQSGDVLVGVDGTMFIAMPDDYTEVKTVIFGGPYPAIDSIFNLEYPESITFSKGQLIETVNRAVHFAGTDRAPVLILYVGREQLAVSMVNAEVGEYGDVIDIPGQADHPRAILRFTPSSILESLNNSPASDVTLHYNTAATNRPVKITGGSGFECWLAPRSEITPAE